ncbi:MAG: hydrogenase [Actinophytocola sp.]|uniref:proton-conducting transporter transmembrane domain-containing protein n=1 Tax=Actinophytocola sp. TaxID=1872138 RepID=UPI0013234D2F|nr:proton-conducting transporter membrane subunit [Actinophytocola sp.]MPZ81769.1 hydrogenase [Actinophytocola sp.]
MATPLTTLLTTVLMVGPVALPGIGAVLYGLLGWRPDTTWLGTVCAAGILVCGIGLGIVVAADGPHIAAGGLVRVDALSAFMIIVIGAIGLLATAASPAFLQAEIHSGRATARTAARHSLLVQSFLAAMALAVLAANLGVVWVAVEATTIVTAFLVGQGRSRASVEAAWKYVVICSVGIALAFLGMILLNYASEQTLAPAELDWVRLAAGAADLDPGVTRIAVALLVVGFGTKVGLAPLHAWLPDAHSQAPAPVSALMSGVLLSVAFYAILRVKVIADAALGAGFVRALLLVMALATLAVATSLLLAQRDYKRMLAYHSMEHMGLLALGTAAGSRVAVAAVLLHILGHGLAKAVLFLSSGRILQLTGSRLVSNVRGLAAREPVLAGLVGLGVLALLGFPPFSLFASELGIFTAGYAAGTGWATSVALVLVLVITAALLGHAGHMLLGDPSPAVVPAQGPGAATAPDRTARSTTVPLAVGLAVCAVLGVAAGPLLHLLSLAADILTGTS